MRFKSITLRLTLFLVATSSAVLIGVGSLVGILIDSHFEEQDLAEMSGKLELIAHAMSNARTNEDFQRLPLQLADALIGHHGLLVSIVAPDGTRVYPVSGTEQLGPLLSGAPLASGQFTPTNEWEDAGTSYRGIAQGMLSGLAQRGPYRAAVAMDISHHRDFMTALWRTLSIAVALGILLTGVLGWFAVQRGLAPVRDIARLAKGISVSRLEDRLAVESVPDELIDLARSFNDMLARLEDSFKRLSEFSSDLAHELRTPVSNLMTQTQVALAKSRTADEYREILYSNLEEYDRLARMVADMLFLAKADHGLVIPHRERVEIGAEVDGLIEFYDALAGEQGVTLQRSGEGVVSGDRLMIRRAVGNLLSNAIRHTPKGGAVRIEVDGEPLNRVRISVANEGLAIEARHLPRLFDRFYRVDPSRKREGEGVGLGLAITRSIVVAHGGTISVRSDSGATRFDILLEAAAG